MEQSNTVPVKLSLSGSKKRARLHVPLKILQLRKQVRSSFPNVKEFDLQYVDEEGDNITVNTDEDLAEAQSVFKILGRVISFIVDASSTPERPVQAHAPAADSNIRKSPLRPTVNYSKAQKGTSEFDRSKLCPKPCADDFNFTCDFNRLGQMANHLFGNPECLANAMRSFIGPATGDLVELHSLLTADFNGRRGRCGSFDRTTGRHQVVLFATETAPGQTIAVRTRNLKAIRPCSPKKSAEHGRLLPTKTSFGPGSFGPHVVMLQKALIKLGYMHPSAIRHLQGLYGPRTTTAVAKIAKAIGCTGGGAFTDRVRAHLLHKLASETVPTTTTTITTPPPAAETVPTTTPPPVVETVPTTTTTTTPPPAAETVPTTSTTATPPPAAETVPTTTTTATPPAAETVPTTTPLPVVETVPTTSTPPPAAETVPTTTTTTTPPPAAEIVPTTTTTPPVVVVTVPTTVPPVAAVVASPTTTTPPAAAMTMSPTLIEHTALLSTTERCIDESTDEEEADDEVPPIRHRTNPEEPDAVQIFMKNTGASAVSESNTGKSVTVPTKKSVTAPPTKVQQLLDMGIALPVETLRNVLSATNDDVGAALTVLLGCE